jgi:hypothetical protein
MNRVLSEIASTFHRDKCCEKEKGCKDLPGGGIIIWIVIAIVLCLCFGGGSFRGFGGSTCCKPKRTCGSSGGGVGILALLFFALIFAAGGNGSILGAGSSPGNVNTNVLNVGTPDDCGDDEYYEDCCYSQKC